MTEPSASTPGGTRTPDPRVRSLSGGLGEPDGCAIPRGNEGECGPTLVAVAQRDG